MMNAQATEEDYCDSNEKSLREFFNRLEATGGADCTDDAKVIFMLEDATEIQRHVKQQLNHIKKEGEGVYIDTLSGRK